MITELRRYRIKAGRMDNWVEFFEGAARENQAFGIRVEYAGVDRETNTFVWLRTFADEADRVTRKADFYGSPWWLEREQYAMDHVLEYSVEFLHAALIRADDSIVKAPPTTGGAAAGSTPDGPPSGWSRSARATFVPSSGLEPD